MALIANLVVGISANTSKLARGLKKARGQVSGFSGGIGKLSKSLPVLAVAAASAGAAIVAAFKMGKLINNVDRAMKSSLAIMGDVSEEMKQKMSSAAAEVAKTTKFSMEQASESYFFLASAGLTAAESLDAMPVVATFAQAGMFDLARATDLLTDAQQAMGLASDDAGQNLKNLTRVGDVLVKANTIANASVEQFSEALTNKAAAAGRRFGQSIEEVTAVLASFAARGIKGAEAGTQLDIIMRTLSIKAVENEAAFKKAGVSVFDAAGQMRFMGDIIGDLEKSMTGLSDEQKVAQLMQLGFTAKTISSTAALMGASEEMRGFRDSLMDAGGLMGEVADKQLTEFDKGWARLSGSFTEAVMAAQPLIDILGKLLGLVGRGISGLAKLTGISVSDEFESKQKTIGKGLESAGEAVGKDVGRGITKSLEEPATAAENTIKKMEDQLAKAGKGDLWGKLFDAKAAGAGREELARMAQLFSQIRAANKSEAMEDINDIKSTYKLADRLSPGAAIAGSAAANSAVIASRRRTDQVLVESRHQTSLQESMVRSLNNIERSEPLTAAPGLT